MVDGSFYAISSLAASIENFWGLFPTEISGVYSQQEFLGFIPIRNSWDLFADFPSGKIS
jgi:hypothetical protein